MGTQSSPQDWEQVLSSDLAPHIVPAGSSGRVQRPSDVTWLPPGARSALSDVIGRHGLEDLLIVPAAVQPCGGRRRRVLYTPLCVLGAGERAAGLWVQALPEPGIRAVTAAGEVAVIEETADGPQHQLIITGRQGRLAVRYNAAGGAPAGALARRLRRGAAAGPRRPLPAAPAGRGMARLWLQRPDLALLPLDGDQMTAAFRRDRLTRRDILLAVTSRELIIATCSHGRLLPRGPRSRTLYIPRQRIEEAAFRAGTLRLRSAGTDLTAVLGSRKMTGAASSWLAELAACDRIGAGS